MRPRPSPPAPPSQTRGPAPATSPAPRREAPPQTVKPRPQPCPSAPPAGSPRARQVTGWRRGPRQGRFTESASPEARTQSVLGLDGVIPETRARRGNADRPVSRRNAESVAPKAWGPRTETSPRQTECQIRRKVRKRDLLLDCREKRRWKPRVDTQGTLASAGCALGAVPRASPFPAAAMLLADSLDVENGARMCK